MRVGAKSSPAFTLLEVLVGSVVLTLGVILVLQGVTGALGASGRIDRRSNAREAAADTLNRVAAGELAPPSSGEQVRRGVRYRWQVDVKSTQGACRRIVCRVTWSQAGQDRQTSLERLIGPATGVAP